jgi:signal transduction histidine kinase
VKNQFERAARENRSRIQAGRATAPTNSELAGALRSYTVYADRLKIKVLVSELLQNAIKFTPNHGAISLALGEEGDFAVISVRDTGVGIQPEDLGKIFEKFYEVQNSDHHSSSKTGFMGGGLGLGLSLARAIAETHDGGIKVTSKPGEGFTFQVYLFL